MKISSLRLQNYGRYSEIEVLFERNFTALVGTNGTGKTTILDALCEVLNAYAAQTQHHGFASLADEGRHRLHAVQYGRQYRFDREYPVTIEANGDAFSLAARWVVAKGGRSAEPRISGTTPAINKSLNARNIGPGEDQTLPLISYYRANRSWNSGRTPSAIQAVSEQESRFDAYRGWHDASVHPERLISWVIAKSLERFQASSELEIPLGDVENDLSVVSKAVSAAVEQDVSLRYDMAQKALIVEGFGKQPALFNSMSHGQKALICLIADIARRCALLNPHLGAKSLSETPGIVLIDEIDMHLHPKWQRSAVYGLKSAFPKIQFVVGTHSPQVLGELEPDEIVLLSQGGASNPYASYGMDSSSILAEVMSIPSRSVQIDELISKIFSLIDEGDLLMAKKEIDSLGGQAPNIPDIARAQALIRRKEKAGR